jgi:hypothetical protein
VTDDAKPKCSLDICGSTELTLSRGPGRTVGSFARSVQGVFAPIPDDLEYLVCSHGHRQLTPEVESALLAAENSFVHPEK